jgi:predicted NBD/HSP70 family sugar kinase
MEEKSPSSRELKKKLFRIAVFPKMAALSRMDISKRTGLNLRTIVSYAEEYKKLGFIVEKNIMQGKGRPTVYYESNVNNLLFGGISITHKHLHIVIMDVNRYPVGAKCIEIKKLDAPSAEMISDTIKAFDSLLAENPEKKLAGLGFCVTEYRLQTKYLKAFNELASVIERKYAVHTIKMNSNAIILDRQKYRLKLEGNLLLINLADEIRLSLMSEEGVVENPELWRNKLTHCTVDPNGPECYCGKRGCLNLYLTQSAVIERYCRKAKIPTTKDFSISQFRLLVEKKNPEALSIAHENGKYLGRALFCLALELKPSFIYLASIDSVTKNETLKTFRELGGEEKTSIDLCGYSACDICAGTAEMLINYFLTYS